MSNLKHPKQVAVAAGVVVVDFVVVAFAVWVFAG